MRAAHEDVIAPSTLLDDMAAQLRAGQKAAKGDPFQLGAQLGATTDGPSGTSNFTGLSTASGMKACSAGNYQPFDTPAASYEDNVVAWPSVEPADDYTANSLFAFALGAVGLG